METDVLIVGAGPTGLMLACWLARLGVRAVIIDKKKALTRESRALAVQARTLETYDMLGIVKRALAQGVPMRGVNFQMKQHRTGHIQLSKIGQGLSAYPYALVMPQDKTEHLLLDHLIELGGSVLWETEFANLQQNDVGVSGDLHFADGHSEAIHARYICGCDGAGSMVRHALDIGFPGGTYSQRFFVADILGTAPHVEGEVSLWLDKGYFLAFFPMLGEDHYRIVGVVPPQLEQRTDLTMGDVQPAIEQHSDVHIRETVWFSTYNVHHRVAQTFRCNRAFLLGDAGHIHSPAGGQGMNTGLMDASNLGWKLAAVLKGEADERLLASYVPERIAFARQLVATTDRVFSFAVSSSPINDMLGFVIMPVMFRLFRLFPLIGRRLFKMVSQTQISYFTSPISRGSVGSVRAGDRLPWVHWQMGPSKGSSNYDSLRLLKLQIHVYGEVPAAIEDFVVRHPEFSLTRLPYTREVEKAGLRAGAFYLIRPDGYLAYATEHFQEQEFLDYLRDAWGRPVMGHSYATASTNLL